MGSKQDWQKATTPQYMFSGDQWGTGGIPLNAALDKFKRPKYGFDPNIRQSFTNNLRRQAGIAEQGYVNRAGATTPMNVAARLDRFRQGARLGGEVYQQGALPFQVAEQGFAEAQREADRQAGLGMFRTMEERDRFIRQLLAQKAMKGGGGGFGNFMGNALGAAATVAAAAI